MFHVKCVCKSQLLQQFCHNVKFEVRNIKRKIFTSSVLSANVDIRQNEDKKKLAVQLVEISPKSMQPYLKLMRIDKPIGSWLLFWPCSWSIASAASVGSLPDPYFLALFGAGAFIMRGAGCTINDMWDKDIDSQVSRTKGRPLVNGEISSQKAWVFLFGQLSAGLAILLQLNWFSVALGASSMLLVTTYPLMKRVTNWPQLVLGCTFNWGALLGYSAVHGYVNWSVCLPLYLAGVCWTICYDTIYAHQDRVEDAKLGLKSTALAFGEKTSVWLSAFGAGMIGNLVLSGIMNDQTWPYYASVGLIGMHLANQILTLNINNGKDCGEKFISNSNIGLLLFLGIVTGTLFKNLDRKNSKQVLKLQH